MRDVDFVTKKNLEFYHNETVKKLQGEITRINAQIGDVNLNDLIISGGESGGEASSVTGQRYNQETNTTVFVNDVNTAGDIKVNDIYIKRNSNYIKLSSIIGGINSYDSTNGTNFLNKIDTPEIKTNNLYIKTPDDNYKKLYDELNTKITFFDTPIYIELSRNETGSGGGLRFGELYNDDDAFKSFFNNTYDGRTSKYKGFFEVNFYKNGITLDNSHSFEHSDNTEKFLCKELLYCEFKLTKTPHVSYTLITMYDCCFKNANFVVNHVFSVNQDTTTEVFSGHSRSTIVKKSLYTTNEIKENDKHPVTSGAVYEAVNTNTNNLIALRSNVETIADNLNNNSMELLNARKLLYKLTQRVESLDIDDYPGSHFETLTSNGGGNVMFDNQVKLYYQMDNSEKQTLENLFGTKNVSYIFSYTPRFGEFERLKIGSIIRFYVGAQMDPDDNTHAQITTIVNVIVKKQNGTFVGPHDITNSAHIDKLYIAVADNIENYLAQNLGSSVIYGLQILKTPPKAPHNLDVIDINANYFTLVWEDSNNRTIGWSWNIEYVKSSKSWSDNSKVQLTVQFSDLTDGITQYTCSTSVTGDTNYKIRIKSNNATNGMSSEWSYTSVKTLNDGIQPLYIYIPSCYTPASMDKSAIDPSSLDENNDIQMLKINPVIYRNNVFSTASDTMFGSSLHYKINETEDVERIILNGCQITVLLQPSHSNQTFNAKVRILNVNDSANVITYSNISSSTAILNDVNPIYTDTITPALADVQVLDYVNYAGGVSVYLERIVWKPLEIETITHNKYSIYDNATSSIFGRFGGNLYNDCFYAIVVSGSNKLNVLFNINTPQTYDIEALDETVSDYSYVFNISTIGTNVCASALQASQTYDIFSYDNSLILKQLRGVNDLENGFNIFCNKCISSIRVTNGFSDGFGSGYGVYEYYPVNQSFYATPTLKQSTDDSTGETFWLNNPIVYNLNAGGFQFNRNDLGDGSMLRTSLENTNNSLLNVQICYGNGYVESLYSTLSPLMLDFYSGGATEEEFIQATSDTLSDIMVDDTTHTFGVDFMENSLFPKKIIITFDNNEYFDLVFTPERVKAYYTSGGDVSCLVGDSSFDFNESSHASLAVYSYMADPIITPSVIVPGIINIVFNWDKLYELLASTPTEIIIDVLFAGDGIYDTKQTIILQNVHAENTVNPT